MATIDSKATLRTAIADWLNRTDLTEDQLDQFIEMGEAMIYEQLRVPSLEAKYFDEMLAVANSIMGIPSDFLELIELTYEQYGEDHNASGEYTVLSRVSPRSFHRHKQPHTFTRDLGSFLLRDENGEREATGHYSLKYYAIQPPIGTVYNGVEQIPYILLEYELALYSALAFGSSFLGDIEAEARHIALVSDKITNLNNRAIKAEVKGGAYSATFSSNMI